MGPLRSERHRLILRGLTEHGALTVAQINRLLGVSEATVRRDLDALDREGLIVREHGGASRLPSPGAEPPIFQRTTEEEEKRAIALATVLLVEDGQTVFLSSGTTVLAVARALGLRRHLTVITNALNVASLFVERPETEVVVTGGVLRHSEQSLVGHLVSETLRDLRADVVIMGMRGIDVEHGLTSEFLAEVQTDRAIIKSAPRVILFADHTKFGRIAPVRVAALEAVHTIVTDRGTPASIREQIEGRGVGVVVA